MSAFPILLPIVLAALCGCESREGVPTDRLVTVKSGPITRGVIAVGRVEPRTRVELKSKANGIIRRLHVDVSEPVTKGQVIVELDQEILVAGLAEAEGRLRQARARVDLARAEAKRIEEEKRDPEFEYARKSRDRLVELFERGIASEEQHEQALERCDKAQHRERLLDAQLESARATVAAAEGQVQETEAQADLARQELKEATIVSPIDGVVLYRYLEEGDSVSSIRSAGGNATVIMTLGDLDELYVDGEVDEVDVGRIISEQQIRQDLRVRITIESFKQRAFSGRVSRITPLGLEDANGIVTFEVRIVFENPEKLLLANMTANSLIILEEKSEVLLVSQGALITERGARYADIYDPATGRTHRQEVEVGISDGRQVEILGGLEKDQQIVIP